MTAVYPAARLGPYHGRMYVLHHGVDLVEVARIERVLHAHPSRFPRRVFTDVERADAEAAGPRRAERYAVRFAAKEAVMKALGTGWGQGVGWRDIEVRRTASGEPTLHLRGAAEATARARGITDWRLSLSHVREIALASVIAAGTSPGC